MSYDWFYKFSFNIMKKTGSLGFLKSPTNDSKANYYRSIGEQAALHTFKKNPTTHKILLQSPVNKSCIKEDLKKSDFD